MNNSNSSTSNSHNPDRLFADNNLKQLPLFCRFNCKWCCLSKLTNPVYKGRYNLALQYPSWYRRQTQSTFLTSKNSNPQLHLSTKSTNKNALMINTLILLEECSTKRNPTSILTPTSEILTTLQITSSNPLIQMLILSDIPT